MFRSSRHPYDLHTGILLMAEPSTISDEQIVIDPGALRIVLFGLPLAGKSSLLGALAESGRTQGKLLEGTLIDRSQGLELLCHRLYDGRMLETTNEVTAYPVTFQPLPAAEHNLTEPKISAVLFDSDGAAATEILSRAAFGASAPSLVRALQEADALVLVVDAVSAGDHESSDRDFGTFLRFLRLLQRERSRRAAAAGLPIYLVLSKCDLLAQPGDTLADWKGRMEDCKKRAEVRFRDFLFSGEPRVLAFGQLNLHVWATSIKMPPLADAPEQPRSPYGVAELFHQVITEADRYRIRCRRSSRNLLWTVMGSVIVLITMVALAVAIVINTKREDPASRKLQTAIDAYRGREAATPSGRLREPLQARISELTELENRPAFASLPAEARIFVQDRLQELQEYLKLKDQLNAIPRPETAHNQAELDQIEHALQKLQVPAERRAEWSQTEVVLTREHRLEECRRFRAAIAEITKWYEQMAEQGWDLWSFSGQRRGERLSWADWRKRVTLLLNQAEAGPWTSELPFLKFENPRLPLDFLIRFDKAAAANASWKTVQSKLVRLRELSTALGLDEKDDGRGKSHEKHTENSSPFASSPIPQPSSLSSSLVPTSSAPLNIPSDFKMAQARPRFEDLERDYPRFRQDFTLSGVPEAAEAEIRSAAAARFHNLLPAGQALVLSQLKETAPADGESLLRWRNLIPWLENIPEGRGLRDEKNPSFAASPSSSGPYPSSLGYWRMLATVLARLQDPDAADPIDSLVAFLKRDQFELKVSTIVISIPDRLNLRPEGKLILHLISMDEGRGMSNESNTSPASSTSSSLNRPASSLTFEQAGEPKRESATSRYTFRAAGSTSLVYRPSDTFWADMPLRKSDGQGWVLTWTRARSLLYQFECLSLPPRLHRKEQENTRGEVARDIRVEVFPDTGVPAVPAIMPEVPLRLDGR
jgi:hypothetical protein